MLFKDEEARERFKQHYREHAQEEFLQFSALFSLADAFEKMEEKSFENLSDIYFKFRERSEENGPSINWNKVIEKLRLFWKFGELLGKSGYSQTA